MNTTHRKKKNTVYLLISITILVLICISIYIYFNAIATSTLTRKVMSEQDDGRTFEVPSSPDGFGNEPEGWANLEINPTYSFGVRFTNISLPRGSRVIDAYVKLFSIGLPNRNDHVSCTIYADNVDTSDDFYTKGCLDRCGRIYTTNSVLWDAITPFTQWIKTPALTDIIQEIIERPGWEQGNSISLLFITRHTNNSAAFNNFELGNSAELVIKAQM